MRSRFVGGAVAALGLALAACGSGSSSSSSGAASAGTDASAGSAASASCVAGSVTASGSTALQPLVQKAAAAYMAKCPGARVTVSGGGSSTGLANVAGGQSDIGNSDVPAGNARTIDPSTLTDHQVAIVVFAVVVNPKTNVTSLSSQQVRDIFSGKVTNWKDVGGADLPVTLIERKVGSGTRLSFDKCVMKGVAEAANPASIQDSTSLVLQGVQQADGGVSYLNAASASGVTVVSLDNVKPDASSVASGGYSFYAHEHMYTKGQGSRIANDFIAYMLSAEFAPQVTASGFAPVSTTGRPSAADS